MTTLVQIPTGLSSPELEILLSRAQASINDSSSKTIIVSCSGGAGYACSLNIYGLKPICSVCKSLVRKGISELKGDYELIETPSIANLSGTKIFNNSIFNSRYLIKQYSISNVDIGQSAYSSYIGLSRDQDLEGFLSEWSLKRLVNSSAHLIDWYQKLLDDFQVTRVILYNGRQSQYRPLLRIAQNKRIPVDVMEFSGQNHQCVYLFENELPQDLNALEGSINNVFEDLSTKKDVNEIAFQYYAFKRSGGVVNDIRSYVLGQKAGLLPKDWDMSKHNVVIFNSSEDEYAAVGGEYDKTLYRNQTDAITRLCESLSDDAEIVLWLRIHPNLKGVHWTFAKKLLELADLFPNIHVIPGNSKVSSYALLDACNTALSFGSTMGIEAAYWRKPSILVGRCVYEKFGSVYTPQSHSEVISLVRNRMLGPLAIDGALKIAFFWKVGGNEISYFGGNRSEGFNFNNKIIKKGLIETIKYNAAKFAEKYVYGYLINYGFFFISKLIKRR